MANLALPELFKSINDDLGGSLKPMESKDNVVGRDTELTDLSIIMNRKTTQVALLLAPAGTGKSALAGSWMNQQEEKGNYLEMFQLEIGLMGGDNQNLLMKRMSTLLQRLKEYKDELLKVKPDAELVLFIDEVHKVVTVFGENTKIGGDLLKESLARAEEFVKVITATTPDEYNSYIAQDKPLARRFKNISFTEVTPPLTFTILKDWLQRYSSDKEDLTRMVSDRILKKIIYSNRIYREGFYEPAKSIDVLDSLIATSSTTGKPVDDKTLAHVFKAQYRVDLDFNVDTVAVMDNIKRRVKGQPLAMNALKLMVEEVAFQLYETRKRPRSTMLFPGTTGTGKTETVKALCEGITGDEKNLVIISMTDYSDNDSEVRFRKVLGEALRENPSAVVLLDELEKASKPVRNVLLPVLDEGMVTYHDEGADGRLVMHPVSLKNSIIIATTNAGAESLNKLYQYDINKYSGEEMTERMMQTSRNVEKSVVKALGANDFSPEFIARFDGIVPFLTLNEETLLRIARKQLDDLLRQIYQTKGILVSLPPDKDWSEAGTKHVIDAISAYVVIERMDDETDAGKNGAREIAKIIKREILGPIITAIFEHKGCTKFNLETNGLTRFEKPTMAQKRGLIRVIPVQD